MFKDVLQIILQEIVLSDKFFLQTLKFCLSVLWLPWKMRLIEVLAVFDHFGHFSSCLFCYIYFHLQQQFFMKVSVSAKHVYLDQQFVWSTLYRRSDAPYNSCCLVCLVFRQLIHNDGMEAGFYTSILFVHCFCIKDSVFKQERAASKRVQNSWDPGCPLKSYGGGEGDKAS